MAIYGDFPAFQNVTHSGQNNGTGDPRALFMKLFAGEVLTMFRSQNMALGMTRVRTISKGKSAEFPMIGMSKNAKYHKPGELIEAGNVNHAARTVTVDDVAVSAVFVSESDEDLNHFEVRSHYAREVAYDLATMIDKNVFRIVAKAAFITDKAKAEAVFGKGNVLDDEVFTANMELRKEVEGHTLTRGQMLVDAIYRARTEFRKKNVPTAPVCVLRPEDYEALTNAAGDLGQMAWLNSQFLGNTTSDGGGAQGNTGLRIGGIAVWESNNLPDQDESAGLKGTPEPLATTEGGSGRTDAYRGDYSKLVGLIFTKDCAATVKVRDVSLRWVEEPLRLGNTVLAKMFVGHNILRPACAIAILEPTTPPSGKSVKGK
ncbi:capsid protein [Aeromonas veronii]|uniref:capsid protein n=1 Tax=Aeromonas veronii TaxID=654 RepID=UPI003BA1BE31